ncbi:MAG: hypothetical protein HY800_07320 [Ignavibacteriales bacterium]|nr:hypothetical protein [Ignavibacteriales bacterium]
MDNNNIVHIGFHSRGYLKDSIYVARIYPDGRIQIYSTTGWNAKFYFTDNGDEYIVCPISGTQAGLAFYSSKWGELFTQKKYFYSVGYPKDFHLI